MIDPETKEKIVKLHAQGFSQRKIKEKTGVSRPTIRKIVRAAEESKPVLNESELVSNENLAQDATAKDQTTTSPASPNSSPRETIVLQNQPLTEFYANSSEPSRAFMGPNGQWLRRETLPDGREAFLPAEPPASDNDEYARFSEVAVDNYRMTTISIMKKISMNPNVLNSFSYASSKGWLGESPDIGDFINKCVYYAMQRLFGIRFGLIVSPEGGVIDQFEAAKQYRRNLR
jgi:hypothetical protein